MAIMGGLILVALVVFLLMQPMIQGEAALMTRDFEETTEAESRRRVALIALRDAEYDYHTGKLIESDYLTLKSQLAGEALSAIRAVEGVDEDQLEREVAMVRAGLRDGTACASCGHLNPEGSRFCAGCGSALAAPESKAGE